MVTTGAGRERYRRYGQQKVGFAPGTAKGGQDGSKCFEVGNTFLECRIVKRVLTLYKMTRNATWDCGKDGSALGVAPRFCETQCKDEEIHLGEHPS